MLCSITLPYILQVYIKSLPEANWNTHIFSSLESTSNGSVNDAITDFDFVTLFYVEQSNRPHTRCLITQNILW